MTAKLRRPHVTALLALAAAAPALAQTAGGPAPAAPALTFQPAPAVDDAASPRTEPWWTVQVLPSVWYVAPSGKLRLPVTSGTGPAGFTTPGDRIRVDDINLDSTRLSPAGELHINSGRLRFTFQGADYELSHDRTSPDRAGRLGAVAFTRADALKIDFSFGTYEVTGGYRVWDRDFRAASARPEDAADAVLGVYLLAGVRLYDLDVQVERLGPSPARAGADHLFAEPIVGVRAEATFAEDFSLDLQVSGGYLPLDNTESASLDISVAFSWRPTRNLGVRLGWRQVAFSLSDGDGVDEFEYDGRLAGLFLGAVIRF